MRGEGKMNKTDEHFQGGVFLVINNSLLYL